MQAKLPKFYRQKIILFIINKFNKRITDNEFQKLLFLFSNVKKNNSEYYFVPCNYGPFSFMAQADLKRLGTLGFVNLTEKLELLYKNNFTSYIKKSDIDAIDRLSDKFNKIDCKILDDYIFSKYPFYTINTRKQSKIDNQNNNASFFSIGYEGKTIDQYLCTLIANNIAVLIDVRRNPISMKYGFSKKTLSSACSEVNIKYIHIPELGIASASRKNLNTSSDYQRLFDNYEKYILSRADNLIKQIYTQYKNYKRIAITCFESDIKMCHRSRIFKKLHKDHSVSVELL